jgi:hypothetical protein
MSSLPRNATSQLAGNSNSHNTPELTIEILTFKKFIKGALCGWVDLTLPAIGLTLHSLGLFEKDGRRWLGLPQREYEAGGERKFAAVAEFIDRAANERFQRAALTALDAFRRGGDV